MLLELQPPGAILLYPFRVVDPVSGKRTRSRCVAERHEIAARHERWEIIGGAEGRSPSGVMFSPSSTLAPRAHLPVEEPENEPPDEEPPDTEPPIKEPPVNDPPVNEPPVDDPSAPRGLARFLVLVFLRRYAPIAPGTAATVPRHLCSLVIFQPAAASGAVLFVGLRDEVPSPIGLPSISGTSIEVMGVRAFTMQPDRAFRQRQ